MYDHSTYQDESIKQLTLPIDDKLEVDDLYKVDPEDILNHKVLQRHANLIVDFNCDRKKC